MATFEENLDAYARGVREPRTTLSIARHLAAAHLTITTGTGHRVTALHFYNEAFAAQASLKEVHRREYIEAIAVGPYTRGDGVTEIDLCTAFKNSAVRSRDLVVYACDFIKDSDAGAVLTELRSTPDVTVEGMQRYLQRLTKSKVLLTSLNSVPICDWTLETDLTTLRHRLLSLAESGALSHDRDTIHIAAALASQCTLNEYVFEEIPEETKRVSILIDKVAGDISNSRKPSRLALAVIAAYRRLHETLPSLSGADLVRAGLEKLARLHFFEPQEEARLITGIRTLTSISDPTSSSVRGQYESNPFPTWTAARISATSAPARERIAAGLFGLRPTDLSLPDVCSILVAGCGTGQQPIEMASEIQASRILAIDLSRRSLAYAKRKAIELRVKSIEFAQADILELSGLDERFDIISSVGVLHHTRSVSDAWRILRWLLKPRGVMQISLYSKLARRRITEARELIATAGIEPSNENVRHFRQSLSEVRPDLHRDFITLADYYSLNQCRDLLFHQHETTHNLPEVGAILAELRLDLLGLNVEPSVVAQYQARFPHDPRMVSIENWHRFELDNPNTFRSMYHLWVSGRD